MLVNKKNLFFVIFILSISLVLAYEEQQGQDSYLAIWAEHPSFYANYTGVGDCTIRFYDYDAWTNPVYMEGTDGLYQTEYELSEGEHDWTVSCYDGNENLLLTDTVNVGVEVLEEDDYGKIEWKNGNPFGKDEEEYTLVDYRLAAADSSVLDEGVDTSARITLKQTDIYGRPTLCYRPDFSEFFTEVTGNCRDCEADGICTLISYSDGEVVFDVTHFSSFGVDGSPVAYEAPEFSVTGIIATVIIAGIALFLYHKKTQ